MPASSTSLSSTGSYRSALSTTSLDRPYYNSSTGSYMASRSSATYCNRSTSYASGSYRSRLAYDGDSVGLRERKSTYTTSEYTRRTRAPSVSDSDSGISGVYATRSERSTSRSRDASASRSESSRTTRSDPLPRAYVSSSTTDLYEKYSPANYIPLSQRLSGSVTGETARSRLLASDTSRPPRRLRPQDAEKQRAARTTDSSLSKTRTTSSTVIPRARWSPSWSDKRSTQSHNGHSLPVADDNGNDLQLSVTDIRRKFDPKMTVTKLPARDPDLLYKTAHSSDNIYGALRNLNGSVSSLVDEKPVPVHRPISSDKYSNGTTGSLKWEFPSHSPSPNRETKASDSSYVIKKPIEPISKIHSEGIKTSSLNSVKNQLNANNVIGKILEKSTTIYVGNGENKNYEDAKSDSGNVLSIEIGKEQNAIKQSKDTSDENAKKNHSSESFGTEGRSKHTSDFASYIQISSPAQTSTSPTGQKRFIHSACNGDSNSSDDSSPDQTSVSKVNGYEKYSNDVQDKRTVHLLSPDEDGTNLRYIDSEPSLDSDGKLFVDYNGRDDGHYEEQGFENKTFEHANGHLLRSKLNGVIKLADDLSNEDEDDARKNNDCNSNDRRSRGDSSSPAPETPLAKRKYREINGESGSLYQIYQNDSLATAKSTSPVNTLSASSSVTLNNSNSTSPCGTLTTSRRRSVDSKSPQPSGEQFTKTSGLNGLRNIGNTCFMNSVVQCLSNTKPLLEYCGTPDAFAPHINTTLSCMKGALIKAFSTVITELWKADEKDGVVNTTSLKAQIQRFAPRFMGYSQQDAQEFLRYLLEGLHEDVNRVTIKPKPILTEIDENLSDAQKSEEAWQRYLRSEDSKVGDIFVGQLKSSLRCTHCSHTSVTFDPFWDLSLPIPSRTGQLKLSQCLSHFVKEEELDGDEKPTCSKCQVRRKCLKWFTVQKFPRVLVLHLKRFSPTERFRGKLNVTVEFPLVGLDMTPLAASASPGARGPPPQSAIYNLYAVSNHSGTTYSGHYTAYCKHPYNGEWHEYNDSRVSPISPKNVVSNEAYVLFYELANGSASS